MPLITIPHLFIGGLDPDVQMHTLSAHAILRQAGLRMAEAEPKARMAYTTRSLVFPLRLQRWPIARPERGWNYPH